MNQQECGEIAELLLEVYASHEPVEPLTATFAGLTVADAYEIQRSTVRRWHAGGAVIKGHKVGLASAAMQRQVGVDQPDYGHLLERMFCLEHLPIPTGVPPARIEPEIAFVLGSPAARPRGHGRRGVAGRGLRAARPGIVDSRIRDWKISMVDTIADNASSGGVVLGGSPVRGCRPTCG